MHILNSRRGESSASSVAIVAIVILVLIGLYLIFFRGGSDSNSQTNSPDINVDLPEIPGGNASGTYTP